MNPTKPYQLCTWTDDPQSSEHRTVETISYPFMVNPVARPTLIKVRMVPGDPTTLTELPVAELEVRPAFAAKRSRSRLYVHYAEVRGSGVFPDDMLRYDDCALVSPELQINERDDEIVPPRFKAEDGIMVYSVSDRKTPRWTNDRWFSFLWSIKPVQTLALDHADR